MYPSAHILHYVAFVKNQPRILSFWPQSCCLVSMFLFRAETTCGASLRCALHGSLLRKEIHFSKIFGDYGPTEDIKN